jgi:Tfp pilus assembly protein PilF
MRSHDPWHGGSEGAKRAAKKYHLAMAYFKSGDGPRGTAKLNQALKMDSDPA